MNEAAASLVRIMEGYESYRRGESLSLSIFLIQIFLGNIILRHLMRMNLLLVSVTSVFRHGWKIATLLLKFIPAALLYAHGQ